jgi:hypothetical protein
MSVEEPKLLPAVHSVEGVIDVQDYARGTCRKLAQYSPTMARAIRSRARTLGKFFSREVGGCEQSAASSGRHQGRA